MKRDQFIVLLLLFLMAVPTIGQDDPPPAEIVNDEGGPIFITGSVEYTNAFFTLGVAEPLIILEDQAGFVDRNEGYLMSPESQTLGQITSDFFTSPFTYSITLPIVPRGEARDVDNDEEEEEGIQIFAIAYWTNTWGDPFLEERDLYGGGWSTAYASTDVSSSSDNLREVVGGKYLIYASDDKQGFPSGFGDDQMLFTEDDPIVIVPAGYTVVDMNSDPFIFDRSAEPIIDLIEGEGTEAEDYSELSYTEAFDAMIDLMAHEYAFTEHKGIDWDAVSEEFRPRFEEAEENEDDFAYRLALQDLAFSIPDGHIGTSAIDFDAFQLETAGGIGMAIRELDDGRVVANFILESGPADEAGIELGAEILEIDGRPISEVISENVPWSSPFSTEHMLRLQQLRYVTRFPLETEVDILYQNPGDEEAVEVSLTSVAERDSFRFSSFNAGLVGDELPVEYEMRDDGLMYAKVFSFSDNELLTIQLWERMIQTMNDSGATGLIIDMRQNGGGSGFLADQMAAYFFEEQLELGNSGYYDEDIDDFFFDERTVDIMYPPSEDQRYLGEIAVIIGPACLSACEFFSYDMALQDRATIVGHYPTGGLGGSVEVFFMPDGEQFQFTIGRAVDADGKIHIEGTGVIPTLDVPVTEETLLTEDDVLLNAAIEHLLEATAVEIVDGGEFVIGEEVMGELAEGVRIQYFLPIPDDIVLDFVVSDESGELDTVLNLYLAEDTEDAVFTNDDADDSTVNSAAYGIEIPAGLDLMVEVASFNDAESGEFTLSITEGEPE